jgi:hypothetical protein
MRSLPTTKKVATITAAAFILMAITSLTTVTTFATADAESSVRVSQSNNDGSSSVRVSQSSNDGSSSVIVQSDDEGLEVNCEGDVNCEVIGDDTVVATSEDGDSASNTAVTTTTTDATTVNELSNDVDSVVEEELDGLGERIERMVDRLLDDVSASLASWRISLFT